MKTCAGERATDYRNLLALSLKVTHVRLDVLDGIDGTTRADFDTYFARVLAQTLAVSDADITVTGISRVQAGTINTLRRWLQDQGDVLVSFTVAVGLERKLGVKGTIGQLQFQDITIQLGDGATTQTSTFTRPADAKNATVGIPCSEGHQPKSPLCNVCLEGWMAGMDQLCIECEGASVAWVRVVALCVGIILVCLLVFVLYTCYRRIAARGAAKDAQTLRWVKPSFLSGGAAPISIYGKIVVSHYQILTQFPVLLATWAVESLSAHLHRHVPNHSYGCTYL